MRIGIISQFYYPITGGISEHVYYLAKSLKKLGHEPSIITSKFFNHKDIDGGNGSVNVIRIGWNVPIPIPINGTFGNVNVGYQVGMKINNICVKEKFDLVHIHNPMDPTLPLTSLRNVSIPKIGTFHNSHSRYNLAHLAYEIFRNQLRQYADLLDGRITVSHSAEKFLGEYFPGDISVIPNGIDLDRFNPNVKPLEKFNDGTINILFVGRMDTRKGLKYLLKAFSLISEQYPRCRLIIVGGGWLKNYYKIYLSNGLSKKVFFEGYVSRADLPRYYASSDIFCAPAIGGESFGIVLLEAMASGKPIVASDISGYNELIQNGKEGILVAPENPKAIMEAVIKLINHKDLRKKLGENGLLKAKEYGWDEVTKQIEDCYYKVLAKNR